MSTTIRRHGRLHHLAAGVLACALAALALTAEPSAARAPIQTIVQDDAALLHRSDEEVAQNMRRLRALGVDRVRLTAGWSVLAPDPDSLTRPEFDASDPDAYPADNWRMLDRAVREARDAGLDVMIDIAFWAPLWATEGDPNEGRARWNIKLDEYTHFTRAVVRRYSGSFVPASEQPDPAAEPQQEEEQPSRDASLLGGIFGESDPFASSQGQGSEPPAPPEAPAASPLPEVKWWTIWNEPNHPGFVQPQWEKTASGFRPQSPHIYRRMVEAAYPAIKEVQPDSLVLVGGTSSTGAKNPTDVTMGVPPLQFVRELACVDERLEPLSVPECADYRPLQGDGFSHHPYSLLHKPGYGDPRNKDNVPIGELSRLTTTLNELVRRGRISAQIRDVYLTEFGYETNPPDPVKPFNPIQSARYINWAEYLAWKDDNVKTWPQFLLYDLGTVSAADADRGKREWGDWQSGLFFQDGSPKPSATSFKLALHAECLPAAKASRAKKARRAKRARRASAKRRRARRATVRTVEIWGHIRPGAGPRRVALQVKRRGADWAPLAGAFETDAGGFFTRRVPHERGAQFRVEHEGELGLPTSAVNCGRTKKT